MVVTKRATVFPFKAEDIQIPLYHSACLPLVQHVVQPSRTRIVGRQDNYCICTPNSHGTGLEMAGEFVAA